MGYKNKNEWLQEDYKRRYGHSEYARRGGFFSKKRRKQLLGLFGKTGRDRKKYDFWYDVRETVKTALLDLRLFIETADEKDVNAVLNVNSLDSVVGPLLHPFRDRKKAKIAQLFIEYGFRYLRNNSNYLTKKQNDEINDAVELSNQLTLLILPDSERENFTWKGMKQA